MGKQQVWTITDDMTGKPVDEAVTHEVELTLILTKQGDGGPETTGRFWPLVYSPETYAALEKALTPFLKNVPPRPANAPKTDSSSGDTRGKSGPNPRTVHIRDWWKGMTRAQLGTLKLPEPKDHGRIPAEVAAAYDVVKPEGHIAS
jgi:hypothetical protein